MGLINTVKVLVLIECVNSMYSSKALEGYPAGLMSDCPGSTIPIKIPRKQLKYLTFTVHGDNWIGLRPRKYNYFQMKNLPKNPDVDFKRRTVVYVGGYSEGPVMPFAPFAWRAYRKKGYNVFLLDTSHFTTDEYAIAARNMRTIGKHVAEMLLELTSLGLDPKKLELVGLSLGGHTISFIAKNYRHLTGLNISRVTGLDPTGLCFRNLGPEDRLDQNDADFVDVIHTNIDGYGMAAPIGHVNFYVNGGEFQPGDLFWMSCTVVCSHIRSFTIWIAALEHRDQFIAMKCDSVQDARNRNCYERIPLVTNVLGLNTDKNKEGIFYLATNNSYPYFLGEKGLRRENEFFDTKLNLFRRDAVTNQVPLLSAVALLGPVLGYK